MSDIVKPLEWVDYPINGEPVVSMAEGVLGTYFICDDTDDFTGLYLEFVSHKSATWFGTVKADRIELSSHNHIDDHSPLQIVAQADYERRILSALTTDPQAMVAAVLEWAVIVCDYVWEHTAKTEEEKFVAQECEGRIRALTPTDARAAFDRAIAEAEERGAKREREACAKLVETILALSLSKGVREKIAASIRARGESDE